MGFVSFVVLLGLVIGGYFWIGAATLAAVFAVGSLAFWILLAVAVGVAWYLEESQEDGVLAVFPFVAFCLVIHFISHFNLVAWGKENVQSLCIRVAAYLAIGFVYPLFRWLLHLRKKAGEIDALVRTFRTESRFEGLLEEAPDEVKLKFSEFIRKKYQPNLPGVSAGGYDPVTDGVVPEFGPNKFVMFRWFWWWPFSLLGWFLNDLIRDAWNVIKRGLQHLAEGLSGLVFGRRAEYVLSADRVRELQAKEQQRLDDERQASHLAQAESRRHR
jgi:hypothetical protein